MVPCIKIVVTVDVLPGSFHLCLLILLGIFAWDVLFNVQDSGIWFILQTVYITVHSARSQKHLAGTGDGICLHRCLLCKVSESSGSGQLREVSFIVKPLPLLPNVETQGVNQTIVISPDPSSFSPIMHFLLLFRYLFGFYFLPPFSYSSFILYKSFLPSGTVKSAAQGAGEALDVSVEHPVQWETAGVYFVVGLVELGSTDLALSCLWLNRKSSASGQSHCHLLIKSPWFLE